jgi:hypothetical protein
MVIFGLAAKAIWAYFFQYHNRLIAQLMYASTLPLMVVFVRGTLPATLSYALFVIAPLVIANRIAGDRHDIASRGPADVRTKGGELSRRAPDRAQSNN